MDSPEEKRNHPASFAYLSDLVINASLAPWPETSEGQSKYTHCQGGITDTLPIRLQTRIAQSEHVLLTESPWMFIHSFTKMKFT